MRSLVSQAQNQMHRNNYLVNNLPKDADEMLQKMQKKTSHHLLMKAKCEKF